MFIGKKVDRLQHRGLLICFICVVGIVLNIAGGGILSIAISRVLGESLRRILILTQMWFIIWYLILLLPNRGYVRIRIP